MSEKLKPCPFCEDGAYAENKAAYGMGGFWAVICSGCEAEGPATKTEAEAIAAWNKRAQCAGDAWQPIETAPNNVPVLVAAELPMHAPGDWHIKVGALQQGHWRVWGAAWIPTHWMPLPPAPATTATPAAGEPTP